MHLSEVHNPATLLIVNGGKKKKMATAIKRNRGGGARTRARRPNRRRNSTAVVVAGQQRPTAQNRRRNPGRRRRRNPQVKGLITDALYAAVGGMATNVAAGFIPINVGGLAGIGVRFGVAYLVGWLAEKVVGPHPAQMIAVGGAASAAGSLIDYAFGMTHQATTGLLNPATQPAQLPEAPPPGVDGFYDPDYFRGGNMADIVAADDLADIVETY